MKNKGRILLIMCCRNRLQHERLLGKGSGYIVELLQQQIVETRKAETLKLNA